MRIVLVCIIFCIGYAWGQSGSSCQGGDRVSRLDDEVGEPLYGQPVQDQDGLGTCYGNALSLALKTVLPGAPDVSYLDISVQDNKIRPIVSGFVSKDGNLFNYGGVVRSAFEKLKKVGYCPRSSFPLENDLYHPLYPLAPGVQSDALERVGEFLDLTRTGQTIDSAMVKSYVEKMGPLARKFSIAARAQCAQDFSAIKYLYKMLENPVEDIPARKELLLAEIAELRTQQSQLYSGQSLKPIAGETAEDREKKSKEIQDNAMEIMQAIKQKQKEILELELVGPNGNGPGDVPKQDTLTSLQHLSGDFYVEYNLLLSKYSVEKSDQKKSDAGPAGQFIAEFKALTDRYGVPMSIPPSFSDQSLLTLLHDDLERSLPGPCFKRTFQQLTFSEEAAKEILHCPNMGPKYRALLEVLGLSQQVDSIMDTFQQSSANLVDIKQPADVFLSLFAPQCLRHRWPEGTITG